MDFRGITGKIKSLDKKTVLRASIISAVAVLAAGYALSGKDNSYASVPKAEAPVSVTTVTIEPKTIDTMVSAVGVLSSKNTSVLSSKVMGR
jgi:multidrug efflux pump subunit AcrA (membrane-fusion protein)